MSKNYRRLTCNEGESWSLSCRVQACVFATVEIGRGVCRELEHYQWDRRNAPCLAKGTEATTMALILTTITEIVPTTIGAIWATATIIVAVAAHRATIKAARDECFRCDKPGHWAHDTATLTWTPGPLQALLVPIQQ